MLLVHINIRVNGHVLGRAMAVAARQKVPHHQYASRDPCGDQAYQHPLLTQKSYRQLLQLTGYAFATYKALGKRESAREGSGSGGQTKSAPARHYDHILECLVTPKSYRQLLQLKCYAFATYKALGKRASAREGNGSGGQTKSAPRAPL
jgi:hypothetical protein